MPLAWIKFECISMALLGVISLVANFFRVLLKNFFRRFSFKVSASLGDKQAIVIMLVNAVALAVNQLFNVSVGVLDDFTLLADRVH